MTDVAAVMITAGATLIAAAVVSLVCFAPRVALVLVILGGFVLSQGFHEHEHAAAHAPRSSTGKATAR